VIVASLLLILVAVALLVLGLANGSSQLLIGSIGASLLAAIALVIGARQASAARAADRERAGGERDAGGAERAHTPARERVAAGSWGGPARTASADATTESFPAVAPSQGVPEPEMPATAAPPPAGAPGQPPMGAGPQETGESVDDEEDPPDEPARQQVSPADAARVARMSTSVMVIDGRPRYHLAGCVHLLGRDGEPLPVNEAVELGFTPCSLCEPDTALLADLR
jgi:hypothetical protein